MSDALNDHVAEFVINGELSTLDGPLKAPEPDAKNWLAVTSVITGVVVPPLGILLGHLAMREVRRGRATNRKLASRALLISYQALALMWALVAILTMSTPVIPVVMCVALGLASLAGGARAFAMYRDQDNHTPAESQRVLLTACYCLMLSVALFPVYGAIQPLIARLLP